MRVSCVNLGPANGPDNSEEEIGQIWNAVQLASYYTRVDHRFILAILLQESKGCVRVRTTANPIPNPGLMQAHDGAYSCNIDGELLTPCPPSQIFGMVLEGAGGIPSCKTVQLRIHCSRWLLGRGRTVNGLLRQRHRQQIDGMGSGGVRLLFMSSM